MQILVISDKIPASRLGDGLRLFGLLRPLVQRHRFDLLCFARSGDQLEPAANDLFSTVRTLPFPASRAPSLAHRITGAFRLRNFKASSAEMRAAISAAVSTGKYDVVLDVSANMLLSLPEGPMPVPLVVDSMDEPLLRDFRALRHLPVGSWPRLLRQILMYWRYERAMLGRAAINVYASELDAEFYRSVFPGRRVAFVPNGVDLDFFRVRGSGGERVRGSTHRLRGQYDVSSKYRCGSSPLHGNPSPNPDERSFTAGVLGRARSCCRSSSTQRPRCRGHGNCLRYPAIPWKGCGVRLPDETGLRHKEQDTAGLGSWFAGSCQSAESRRTPRPRRREHFGERYTVRFRRWNPGTVRGQKSRAGAGVGRAADR